MPSSWYLPPRPLYRVLYKVENIAGQDHLTCAIFRACCSSAPTSFSVRSVYSASNTDVVHPHDSAYSNAATWQPSSNPASRRSRCMRLLTKLELLTAASALHRQRSNRRCWLPDHHRAHRYAMYQYNRSQPQQSKHIHRSSKGEQGTRSLRGLDSSTIQRD